MLVNAGWPVSHLNFSWWLWLWWLQNGENSRTDDDLRIWLMHNIIHIFILIIIKCKSGYIGHLYKVHTCHGRSLREWFTLGIIWREIIYDNWEDRSMPWLQLCEAHKYPKSIPSNCSNFYIFSYFNLYPNIKYACVQFYTHSFTQGTFLMSWGLLFTPTLTSTAQNSLPVKAPLGVVTNEFMALVQFLMDICPSDKCLLP